MKFARKFAAVLMLVVLATPLFATPTALTPIPLKQNNYAVQAGDLLLSTVPGVGGTGVTELKAMDATNGNSFVWTGREVLLFLNTDTSAHTVTINSVADPFGRLDTSLTTYSIQAEGTPVSGLSGTAIIEFSQGQGWIGSGNVVTMTTSSALVYVAVVRYQ